MAKFSFIGNVHIDGQVFTHCGTVYGFVSSSREKILDMMHEDVRESFTQKFLDAHFIAFKIMDLYTKKVEVVVYEG